MRDNTNASQLAIELSKAQSLMVELEWYKERCEKAGRGSLGFGMILLRSMRIMSCQVISKLERSGFMLEIHIADL